MTSRSLRARVLALPGDHLGRLEAWDILAGAPQRRGQVYHPAVHPRQLLERFRQALAKLEPPERVVDSGGNLSWRMRPVCPPTVGSFAAELGVRRATLLDWAGRCPVFRFAYEQARCIQEVLVVAGGSCRALDSRFSAFLAVNVMGWSHRVRRTERPPVRLLFDGVDAGA